MIIDQLMIYSNPKKCFQLIKKLIFILKLPKIKQKREFVYWIIYKFVVISIKFQFQWVLHSNKQFKHFQFASKNNSCKDLVESTKITMVNPKLKNYLTFFQTVTFIFIGYSLLQIIALLSQS